MMTPTDTNAREEAAQIPFSRVFVAIAGIYVAQSLVSGLTFQSFPAILRISGAPLDQIGLVSLALLPWALKFLWAPAVERYRMGGHRRRSRQIVIAGEIVVAAALLAAAALGPSNFAPLLGVLAITALASATVDIACDAFAVEQLSKSRRGWGNTAQVGGSYLGFMLGGGVYLWTVAQIGFAAATAGLAFTLLLLAMPFAIFARETEGAAPASSHRPSLRFALARREVRLGLLLTMICGLGPRIGASLIGPFMIDRGVDLGLLGILNGSASVGAGLAGTFIGGLAVQRLGAAKAVVAAVTLEAAALAALWTASSVADPALPLLVAVMVGLTAAMAVGFVAMYALLMGASSLRQAGVDFTLFQCADATIATVGGMSGGLLAAALGYTHVFALTLSFAVAAAALAMFLTPIVSHTSDEEAQCPKSAP